MPSETYLPGRAKRGEPYLVDESGVWGVQQRNIRGKRTVRATAGEPRRGRKNRRKARS